MANTFNHNDKVVITDGGSVGIGTTSPSATLHLSAASPYVYFDDTSTSGTRNRFQIISGDVGTTQSALFSFNNTSGTSLLDVMTLNESGNVGIGTTSPSAKLEIYDTSAPEIIVNYLGNSVNGALWFNRNAQKKAGIVTTSEGSYARKGIAFYTNDAADYTTDATEKVRIDDSGNVGIGTTSPSDKLHIKGNLRVEDGSTTSNFRLQFADKNTLDFIIEPSDDTNPNVFRFRANSQNAAAGLRVLDRYETDYISLRHDGAVGVIETDSDGGNIYISPQGSVAITATTSGNVGIGTTSPSSELEVSSSTLTELKVTESGSSVTTMVQSSTSYGWIGTKTNHTMYIGANDGAKITVLTSGNVGIGTTSPSYALHINGNGSGLNLSGGNNRIYFGGNRAIEGSSDGGTLQLGEGYTQVLLQGSNVSIGGTSSSLGPLNVAADSGANAIFIIGRSSGNAGRIDFYTNNQASRLFTLATGDGATQLYGDANIPMTFSTNGTERMRITNDGNVGIGTTSPSKKLDVRGGYFVTSDGGSNQVAFVQGGNGYAYFGNLNSGPVAIGNSENYRTIVVDGDNVGIGTTSPTGKLHIADDGPNALVIGSAQTSTIGETNDGGYPGMKIVPYNSNIHIGISSTNDNKINLWYGGSNYTYWQQLSSYSVISNYSTNALVLQVNGGNVGIGTTAPTAKLHVEGDGGTGLGNTDIVSLFKRTTTNQNSYIGIDTTTADRDSGIRFGDGGTNRWTLLSYRSAATDGFAFYNHTANNFSIFIDNSSNVGIGTTSPSQKLDVVGNIRATGLYYNGSGGELRIDNSYGGGIGYYADQNGHTFNTWVSSWQTRMVITDAGNVGIGTTSPSYKLTVAGRISIENDILHITSASPKILLSVPGGGIDSQIYNDGAGNFIIGHGANSDTPGEKLRIDSTGNVGIGTTSPAYKLDVSGGAIAIRGNAAGNSLRFDDSTGTSRNAMYVDTSNYLNIGNSNYAGVKFVQTATAPNTGAFDGQSVQQAVGTTDNGTVLAEPAAWLAVRVGTTDYAIPMYTTG